MLASIFNVFFSFTDVLFIWTAAAVAVVAVVDVVVAGDVGG